MDVLPHLTLLNFSSQAWTLDTVNSVYHNHSATAKPLDLYCYKESSGILTPVTPAPDQKIICGLVSRM